MVINKIAISIVCFYFIVGCSTNENNNVGTENQKEDTISIVDYEKKGDVIKKESVKSVNYTGDWLYSENDENTVFEIKLIHNKENGNLKGTHCFVADQGNKIDCSDLSNTFQGRLNGDMAKIKLKSEFEDDSLQFNLKFENDSVLILDIIDKIGLTLFVGDMKFKKIKK